MSLRSVLSRATVLAIGGTFLYGSIARAQQPYGGTGGCTTADSSMVGDPTFRGRFADQRIGFLSRDQYICRWHLERKDATAAISDVVTPITVLIDADVPVARHPYITQAVQAWESVFESIGFRHVFVVRVATPADSAKPPKNLIALHEGTHGGGPPGMATECMIIPETGQTMRCSITLGGGSWFTDASRLQCMWSAGDDPNVPILCPDSILGNGPFKSAVEHELGHTLGLEHNFFGSNTYPADSLRSATFVHRWGHMPSVMGYTFYNYSPRPEDHVPQLDRWMHVGPYDYFAIAVAYRPIPEAKTPEDELPTLERWRTAQDTAPYLRWMNIGDAMWDGGHEYVKAIAFQASNRVRLWKRLFAQDTAATLRRIVIKDPYDMSGQWQTRFINLIKYTVGAQEAQAPFPRNEDSIRYTPIETSRQLEAIRFVLAYTVYGQDPYLQLLDTVIGKHHNATPTDSVPFVFDTTAQSHFPDAVGWQSAQASILTNLVETVAKVPPEALPEACGYLATAVRHLKKYEAGAPPAFKQSAVTLRSTLESPNGCPAPQSP